MPKKLDQQELNNYPAWAPRFWHGMLLGSWLNLVLPRLHRLHPLRVPMAIIVTFCAACNSLLYLLERLFFGRAIDQTKMEHQPIFILGHWRSGTTYLHELLVLDKRYSFPTTYECFAPNHFVLTGWFMPKLLGFLLPAKRPNDDMVVSFDHPQEDEFALLAMGAPSPMLRLAFPNDPPMHMELLDMQGVAEQDLERWKQSIVGFVRKQTYLKGKPLILKSPPHTGRIRILAELFPGAKFIHLVRDPHSLFPSTRRLWYALEQIQGFQFPRYEQLDEYVFSAFERMYQGFEAQREAIHPSQILDVRYEDLAQDPVREIGRMYEHLGLGDFEPLREILAATAQERKSYRPARHSLEEEIKAGIRRRWGDYLEKYGYDGQVDKSTVSVPTAAAD